MSVASPEIRRTAMIKFFVILLAPLVVYVVEQLNIQGASELLQNSQKRVKSLTNERAKFGDVSPRVEKYSKEKERVDVQMEQIRAIARQRLKELKTLDALQSLVPEKAWLKKISMEGFQIKIEGYAQTEEVLTQIIRSIEGSSFFSKVEPKSILQEQVGGGTAIRFMLECKAGKSDG